VFIIQLKKHFSLKIKNYSRKTLFEQTDRVTKPHKDIISAIILPENRCLIFCKLIFYTDNNNDK